MISSNVSGFPRISGLMKLSCKLQISTLLTGCKVISNLRAGGGGGGGGGGGAMARAQIDDSFNFVQKSWRKEVDRDGVFWSVTRC